MKLQLALKAEYFDAIKAGTKTEEFRLISPYWTKRLYTYDPFGPNPAIFDSIVLTRGYPKRGDPERTLERAWRGFTARTITHPHFGPEPVEVYVIDVRTPA